MVELQFLKLLLNHQFYIDNKKHIVDSMFPDHLQGLYRVLVDAHEAYGKDITEGELKLLHDVKYPTLPTARKTLIAETVIDLSELEPLQPELGADIMASMWKREMGRRLAEASVKIMDGTVEDISEIASIVSDAEGGFKPKDTFEDTPSDVEEVVGLMTRRVQWQFNIPSLHQVCSGISGGDFLVVGARPNAGKTAFPISLSVADGGFCHQGATVHYFGNEEPVIRTRMRSISACAGMTYEQIKANTAIASKRYRDIASNMGMFPAVGSSIEALDLHVATHRPDIVIADQLDKFHINGVFTSDTDKLRKLYIKAREIAIKYDCVFIGLSQASADADGKEFVTYTMLENSKTGKAAEADLIIGIGLNASSDTDPPARCLYISKNKLTGFHGPVYCMLDKFTSRYTA